MFRPPLCFVGRCYMWQSQRKSRNGLGENRRHPQRDGTSPACIVGIPCMHCGQPRLSKASHTTTLLHAHSPMSGGDGSPAGAKPQSQQGPLTGQQDLAAPRGGASPLALDEPLCSEWTLSSSSPPPTPGWLAACTWKLRALRPSRAWTARPVCCRMGPGQRVSWGLQQHGSMRLPTSPGQPSP